MITLQRLNMDNSWFLALGNCKLLIDPWLEGVEVDYFKWFNMQWHRTSPIAYDHVPAYDAVFITQKYPDHFHQVTLQKLNPKKVIAPKSLGKKLIRLLPESEVITLSMSTSEVKIKDVTIRFLSTSRKIDPIYDAFLLDSGTESVFLATHGFSPSEKQKSLIKSASPCKLLFTPFNRYKLPAFLGGVVSPGLDGVKLLCEWLRPEHVVATHDEDKHAKGLVSSFAKIQRPKSAESLQEKPWLSGRYRAIKNYDPVSLS